MGICCISPNSILDGPTPFETYKETRIKHRNSSGLIENASMRSVYKLVQNSNDSPICRSSLNLTKFQQSKLTNLKCILEQEYHLFLELHAATVNCVVISPDNHYIVSGSRDKTVRIWNVQEHHQEAILRGHTSSVFCIAVTNNSKYKEVHLANSMYCS